MTQITKKTITRSTSWSLPRWCTPGQARPLVGLACTCDRARPRLDLQAWQVVPVYSGVQSAASAACSLLGKRMRSRGTRRIA